MFWGTWVGGNQIEGSRAYGVLKPNLAPFSSDPLTFDISAPTGEGTESFIYFVET